MAMRIVLSSGNLQGSRWGLRGAEDLGGGLKAIFTLESGFDVMTGQSQQGNRLFGRQAFGGLYGFSNQAGGFADNRAYSVGAGYQHGGLKLGAAYLQVPGIEPEQQQGRRSGWPVRRSGRPRDSERIATHVGRRRQLRVRSGNGRSRVHAEPLPVRDG